MVHPIAHWNFDKYSEVNLSGGITHHWDFNTSGNSVYTDIIGSGDITYLNSVQLDTGISSNATYASAAGALASGHIGPSDPFFPDVSQNFNFEDATVVGWYKIPSPATNNKVTPIKFVNSNGQGLFFNTDHNNAFLATTLSSGNSKFSSLIPIADHSQWNFIAARYDATNSELQVRSSANVWSQTSAPGALVSGLNFVCLHNSGVSYVDELTTWGRLLYDHEVEAIYQSGLNSIFCPWPNIQKFFDVSGVTLDVLGSRSTHAGSTITTKGRGLYTGSPSFSHIVETPHSGLWICDGDSIPSRFRQTINWNSAQVVGGDLDFYILQTKDFLYEFRDSSLPTSVENGGGSIRVCTGPNGNGRKAIDIIKCQTSPSGVDASIMIAVENCGFNEGSDSNLYLFWGGNGNVQPATSGAYGKYDTYPSGLAMYLPLEEDPTGADPAMKDRTRYARHASTTNFEAGHSHDLRIGKGLDFSTQTNNSMQIVGMAPVFSGATKFTMSAWARRAPSGINEAAHHENNAMHIGRYGVSDGEGWGFYMLSSGQPIVQARIGSGSLYDAEISNTGSNLHHLSMVYDGGAPNNSGRLGIWIDGQRPSTTYPAAPSLIPSRLSEDPTDTSMRIGRRSVVGGPLYSSGSIDEIMVFSDVRSSGWNQDYYSMTKENSSLFTSGSFSFAPLGGSVGPITRLDGESFYVSSGTINRDIIETRYFGYPESRILSSQIVASGDFSHSFWMTMDYLAKDLTFYDFPVGFVCSGDGNGQGYVSRIYYSGSAIPMTSGVFEFVAEDGSVKTSINGINLDRWNLFYMEASESTNKIGVSVNGGPKVQQTFNGTINNKGEFWFVRESGANAVQSEAVNISELSFYNQTLSDRDLEELYSNTYPLNHYGINPEQYLYPISDDTGIIFASGSLTHSVDGVISSGYLYNRLNRAYLPQSESFYSSTDSYTTFGFGQSGIFDAKFGLGKLNLKPSIVNLNFAIQAIGSATSSTEHRLKYVRFVDNSNLIIASSQPDFSLSGVSGFDFGDGFISTIPLTILQNNSDEWDLSNTFLDMGFEQNSINDISFFRTNLYASGSPYIQKDITLFEEGVTVGATPISSSLPLFTDGHTPINSSVPLFTEGSIVQNSSVPLFTEGSIVQNSSVPLYISGYGVSSNLDLFIEGYSPLNSSVPLFLEGMIASTSGLDLYTLGHSPINSGVPLSIVGQETLNSGLNLYTVSHIVQSSSLTLSLISPFVESNSTMPLYVAAEVHSSSGSLPLSMWSTANSGYFDNLMLYLGVSANSGTTGGMSLVIPGETTGSINSNMPMVVVHNTTENKALPLYIENLAQSGSSFKRLFIRGEGTLDGGLSHSGNIPLFIARDAEAEGKSMTMYLKAGELINQGKNLYISGINLPSASVNMSIPQVLKVEPSSIQLFTHGF